MQRRDPTLFYCSICGELMHRGICPIHGSAVEAKPSALSTPTERVSAPTSGGVSDHGALTGLGDDDHTSYLTDARHTALAGDHVTNGDTHDHSGGDGAQIDHGGLAGLDHDDHPQYLLLSGQPIVTKAVAYELTATDYTVLVNGTYTITLPTAVGKTGKIYVIKNIGTGVVTIATTSGQTIDGTTPPTLDVAQETLVVQSDNANWHVI